MPAPVITQVSICNSALLKVGADRISSITQDTRAAVLCNALYAQLRDEVLGAHPWRFAVKRAVLAPTGTTPDFGWAYAYDLPSDCLRPLVPDDDTIEWIVETNQILTDESTLNLKYLWRNEDESSWTALFAEAFACRLAVDLAYPLVQSLPLMESMQKRYIFQIGQARAMNGVTGVLPPLEADIWTEARRGNRWNPQKGSWNR